MSKFTILDAELTERCNHNCQHCYINADSLDGEIRNHEISESVWYRILQEAHDLGCEEVRFTGGEPLLRKEFLAIYEFAFNLGYKIMIATNACLITEQIIDRWLKSPPKQISISLYGWDAQSYEFITQKPGSFPRFIKGLKQLQEAFIPFELKIPPIALLIKNRFLLQNFARSLGARNYLPFVWALCLRARPDVIRSEEIKRLRLAPDEAAELIFANNKDELLAKDISLPGLQKKSTSTRIFTCHAGTKRLTVNAYGFLQMCLDLRHPDTLYNLENGSIREALEVFFPKVRKIETNNVEYLQRCAKCSIRSLCSCCPACSWTEYGTLDEPVEYLCTVAHILANKMKAFSVDITSSGIG